MNISTHPGKHGLTLSGVAVSIVVLSMASANPVAAQEREPFSKVATVHVEAAATPDITGQLIRFGPDTVTLLEKGTPHEIPLMNVNRIDAPGDSVKNGTLIGAIVAGAWCAIVCPQGLDGYSSQLPPVLLVNVGLGALIGAGIDGIHVGRTTIYQRDELIANRRRTGAKASLSVGFKF